MLYKQSITVPKKSLEAEPMEELYVIKTNHKLFGLPINHLVWMHHWGEKHFNPAKYERKKEKKEKTFARKMNKAGKQKTINNLQYKRLKKIEALNKKIENGNLRMQWGEKIALYDSDAIVTTQQRFRDYLFSKGMFYPTVSARVNDRSRKVRVAYRVEPGPQYHFDSVAYVISDANLHKLVASDSANNAIKRGAPFSQEALSKERERIDLLLRDKGYYNFSRQYVVFQLDTSYRPGHKVLVRVLIQKPERGGRHKAYKLDSIYLTPDVGLKVDSGKERKASNYLGVRFRSYNAQFHKKVLRQRVFIHRDSMYSRSETFQTQKQLANLDIFKFVNINYDTSDGKFVANIFASPLDRYAWSNEAGVSVTQGFPGPYYSLNFKKRNVFGGLEIFELNGRFGFEGVASATSSGNFYRSTEASLNATISFPQFLAPMSGKKATQLAHLNPRTKFLAGYTHTDRPEYKRSIFTATGTYSWENKRNFLYSVTPFNLNIIRSDTTPAFGKVLRDLEANGNRLINAFKPAFVSSMSFSFTWNQHNYGSSQVSSFFIRAVAEAGGTFLNIAEPGFIEKYKLQPFKFLRLSFDLRRNQVINSETQVAFRFNSGIGYAYSNDRVLPYEKYFFVGGSNSVRAWRPRRLGQGGLPPNESANPETNGLFDYRFEKPGDMVLEGSIELRQKLFGFVHYAVFLDAGNVWNISSNSDSRTKFLPGQFYRELGVGTGFGLRFDFTFLIMRLDIGMKVLDPARPEGERFVLNKMKFFKPFGTDREPVIFNIGIGYPF